MFELKGYPFALFAHTRTLYCGALQIQLLTGCKTFWCFFFPIITFIQLFRPPPYQYFHPLDVEDGPA